MKAYSRGWRASCMIYIYSFLQKVKSQYKNSEKVTVAILDENDDKDTEKIYLSKSELLRLYTIYWKEKKKKQKKKKKKSNHASLSREQLLLFRLFMLLWK